MVADVPGRYQFSLPERRQRDGWFRVGSVDVTTTAVLVGLGIVSMFWYAVDQASLQNLAFTGYDVRSGDVWRVVTWPIVNPPNSIWVVLTLAFFWFVGHSVEERIGRRSFTWLVATTAIVPAVLVSAMGIDPTAYTYGLGVLGIGLLVLFALDNPSVVFFFGIPAWAIAAIYVAIDVLRNLGDRTYEPLMVELLIIIVGLVGGRQCGMVESLSFIPKFLGGHSAANKRGKSKPAKRKHSRSSGSTVVDGPWADQSPIHSPADEAELNGLLDRINDVGIDALSRDEKARLNELSKKLRGR